MARVKSALGDVVEGEQLLRETVTVAERVLGKRHFGTLIGQTHLAQMIARQERYEEAEMMFLEIIHQPRNQAVALDDGEHPDRILAMWYLVKSYEVDHKYDKALSVCREIEKLVAGLGGKGFGPSHPFGKRLEMRLEQLGLAAEQWQRHSSLVASSETFLPKDKEGHAPASGVVESRSKSADALSGRRQSPAY